MVSFIILFFPAVVAVWIFETLSKQRLRPKDWGVYYIAAVLVVNLCCFAVICNLLDSSSVLLHDPLNGITTGTAFVYLLLALPFSILFGILSTFIKKHLQVEVEEPDDVKE